MSLSPEQHRKYQRERMAARRAWLLELFFGGRCKDCGATERLEIDHVDPQAKESHRIWSWELFRLLRELVKCECRCARCHYQRHVALRRPRFQHGTYRAYDTLNCRCAACRKASAQYRQELRQRTVAP